MHRRSPRRHGFDEWCARRVRREWLDRQRGLAPVTIDNYCWNVEQFLAALPQPTQVSVSLLDAGTVTAFMVEYCRDRNTNSVKSMARSVRSFLRFAHATGRTSVGLWGAVPVSAGWHLASLPRSVPAADLEHLLAVAGRWRFTATDRRDYAILLLLARLGLRRGEVAGLRLDDIDWRAGELTVIGKGDRVERLPLPAGPGEAIAAWLVDGRPECQTRSAISSAAHARPPGWTASVRTVCVTRWQRRCCGPGRRCRRWGRYCATAARGPPRSTPRSMRSLCDRSRSLGPVAHLVVAAQMLMTLLGVWLARGRGLDHERVACQTSPTTLPRAGRWASRSRV